MKYAMVFFVLVGAAWGQSNVYEHTHPDGSRTVCTTSNHVTTCNDYAAPDSLGWSRENREQKKFCKAQGIEVYRKTKSISGGFTTECDDAWFAHKNERNAGYDQQKLHEQYCKETNGKGLYCADDVTKQQ